MTDGADDGNRTIIIRPTPGRRQPNVAAMAPERPAPPSAAAPPPPPLPQSTTPPRSAPREPSIAPNTTTARISSGEDGLGVAAAPLLQLMGRVHNTAHPPDPGDLREWTVRQIRIFEREAA